MKFYSIFIQSSEFRHFERFVVETKPVLNLSSSCNTGWINSFDRNCYFQDGGKKYAGSEKQIKESDFGDEDEYQEEMARLGRFEVCENLFK